MWDQLPAINTNRQVKLTQPFQTKFPTFTAALQDVCDIAGSKWNVILDETEPKSSGVVIARMRDAQAFLIKARKLRGSAFGVKTLGGSMRRRAG